MNLYEIMIAIKKDMLSEDMGEDWSDGHITGMHELEQAIQAEYEKLCPKPSEFEGIFNYITINVCGTVYKHHLKPKINKSSKNSWKSTTCFVTQKCIDLPLGIDWRLCCWSLEDSKRIWDEE
jgi:hypothetical protein